MARGYQEPEYREVRYPELDGGLNDKRNQAALEDSETPDCLNVEFDSGAVDNAAGAIKFNNQSAPGTAIRTRCDPALSPLCALPTPLDGSGNGLVGAVEVPLRGYGYLPYSVDHDIGGRFTSEGDVLAGSETFHVRRGRSFEINVSFRIPPEEKLYNAPTTGVNSTASTGTWQQPHGFDQALDECFCIVQKGGDRTAPMSWALAVVNVGEAANLSNEPTSRPSNYALCFIWYDAPQWGEFSASVMKYNLATAEDPTAGASSEFATQSYRAILIHKYVEPGRRYSVAVQLGMDTGSPGDTDGPTNTDWNHDGAFKVFVWDDLKDFWYATAVNTSEGVITQSGSEETSRLEVIRGPTDGLEYLCKYGVRYAGRDAMFLGLGMRFTPWARTGFIPFGSDCTPLGSGGFSMLDRSAFTVENLYGTSTYTLQCAHSAAAAYVVVNHQYLTSGNTNGGFDPKGSTWEGFAAASNANSLRGYKLIATNDSGWSTAAGAVFNIEDYSESGSSYRLTITNGASVPSWGSVGGSDEFATGQYVLVQCFRWHQRDLEIGQFAIYGTPIDYLDSDDFAGSRRKLGLRMSKNLKDTTDDTLPSLLAYWPCDDAGGSVLREALIGGTRNGFLAPFGNAVSAGGSRGNNMVFLSGEGEAVCRDLSTNEVVQRELERMMRGQSQGFGVEMTCVFTEAFYPLNEAENLPDADSNATIAGARPRGVPDLISWDIVDADDLDATNKPRQIIGLSLRSMLRSTDTTPFTRPAGFSVETLRAGDSEDRDPLVHSALQPWYVDGSAAKHYRYDPTAPWVGKIVTIQIGVQTTGVAGTYDVYIAVTPKAAFLPENGDPSSAEMQYWTDDPANTSATGTYAGTTYRESAHLEIAPRDLARSVLTIGGRWNCKKTPAATTALGLHEINARMLVDEVRWFGASPSGALGDYSAERALLSNRDGKLEGTNCLPPRRLTASDINRPLGASLSSVNVTDGSLAVLPGGQGSFSTADAAVSLNGIGKTYLMVEGDEVDVQDDETVGRVLPEFHLIESVTTSQITLATPYRGPSRSGSKAFSFRLLGYTAFADDVRDRRLLLGRGTGYVPASITVEDVVLTEDLWIDESPVGGGWKLRIYSPLGRLGSEELLPAWTRGLVYERRLRDEGILGLYGFNDKVYAGVRGSLYEADDRWREDGPTETITRSLAFRSMSYPAGVQGPLASDYVVYALANQSSFGASATDSYVTVYDCWVKLDEIGQYQTVLWTGNPEMNPALDANSTTNRFSISLRFNRGRPEIVLGSTETYDGTNVPEKGLYVASGAQPIAPGQWTHVRWYLWTKTNGTILGVPYCKVQGKGTAVTVNAAGNGLGTGEWLTTANLLSAGALGRIILGCGRDSYVAPDPPRTFAALGTGQGTQMLPDRLHGYMHSLNGRLAQLAIVRLPWTEGEPADFNPFDVDYDEPGSAMRFVPSLQDYGVGHRINDESSNGGNYGIIYSHPFLSVFHEMGTSTDPFSFTEYGSQLFCTNGGKPVVVIGGKGRFAGVPSPTAEGSFTTERFPLWSPNDKASASDTNDPVMGGANSSAESLVHFNTNGNAYAQTDLNNTDAASMAWSKDRIFGFKAYVRPRRVDGKIQLWRKGHAGEGGPFFNIVDGRAQFGWYDPKLKKDVGVETTAQVFWPGYVHYVWCCKINDLDNGGVSTDGNWQNSLWSNNQIVRLTLTVVAPQTWSPGFGVSDGTRNGYVMRVMTQTGTATTQVIDVMTTAGVASAWTGGLTGASGGGTSTVSSVTVPSGDVLIVKRFRLSKDSSLDKYTAHDAYVGSVAGGTVSRNIIGFTTEDVVRLAGITANGVVSPPAAFEGAASGVVDLSVGSTYALRPEMVGMFFMWGSSAITAVQGKAYRISAINSTTQMVVVDPATGAAPDLSSVSSASGAIFTGIGLRKIESTDDSRDADTSPTSIYFMGSPDQGSETSGFTPFDGEVYSPGFGVRSAPGTPGVDVRVFENASATTQDPNLVGRDEFYEEVYAAGTVTNPHQLQYTTAFTQFTWNGRAFSTAASSDVVDSVQPATITEPDTSLQGPKIVAPSGYVPAQTGTSSTFWRYIRARSAWTEDRWIALALRDPEQDLVGRPGEPFRFRATPDRGTNPTGLVRTMISGLPVGRDGQEVIVYSSVGGGNSQTLFEVARVPSGTYAVSIESPDDVIQQGAPADFANWEPPRCSFVVSSRSRMVFAGLASQPDALVPSRVSQPGTADFDNQFRLAGGFGDRVTGVAELDGLLVVFKRRAMGSVTFDSLGRPFVDLVSSGVGCVAHNTIQASDGALWWLSDRGFQMAMRNGVSNLSLPVYVGEKAERTFKAKVDRRRLHRASSALNRKRDQYVVAFAAEGEPRTSFRVSAEIRPGPTIAYGKYEGANVTALASIQSKDQAVDRLIGGTEEGFVIWMERDDTARLLLGPDPVIWGYSSVTNYSESTTLAFDASTAGRVDTTLEGPRGVTLRWTDANGIERDVDALGVFIQSSKVIVHFAEVAAATIPGNTDVLVGAQRFLWETGWLDMDNPERPKTLIYLDLVMDTDPDVGQPDAKIKLELFADWSEDVVLHSEEIALEDLPHRISPQGVEGRWFKMRISSPGTGSDIRFQVASLVFRVRDEGQE